MKLVKFKDGTYGIRKWTLCGYMYKDLSPIENAFWWGRHTTWYKYCRNTKEVAQGFMEKAGDRGEVVPTNTRPNNSVGGDTLRELCKAFFKYMDKVEVSDNGKEFRPNQISSVRVMDGVLIDGILKAIKSITNEYI